MGLQNKDLIESIRVLSGYIKEVKINIATVTLDELDAHIDKMIELASDALVEATK